MEGHPPTFPTVANLSGCFPLVQVSSTFSSRSGNDRGVMVLVCMVVIVCILRIHLPTVASHLRRSHREADCCARFRESFAAACLGPFSPFIFFSFIAWSSTSSESSHHHYHHYHYHHVHVSPPTTTSRHTTPQFPPPSTHITFLSTASEGRMSGRIFSASARAVSFSSPVLSEHPIQ